MSYNIEASHSKARKALPRRQRPPAIKQASPVMVENLANIAIGR
jgi:hypothetical protein